MTLMMLSDLFKQFHNIEAHHVKVGIGKLAGEVLPNHDKSRNWRFSPCVNNFKKILIAEA